jgi:trimeric autotransporter adhesin
MSRLATPFLTALLAAFFIPAALAQQIPAEPQLSSEPSAAKSQRTEPQGGFAITNAAGDTLFLAEPNHMIRMGKPGVTEFYISRADVRGLEAWHHAPFGSAIIGGVTNTESSFYGVRGQAVGSGAGVLGVGVRGGSGGGVLGVTYNTNRAGIEGWGLGPGSFGGLFYNNTETVEPALMAEYAGTGDGAALLARRYSTNPEGTIALFASGRWGQENHQFVTGIQANGNIWTRGSIHADGNIHAQGTITSSGADFAERFAVVGEVGTYQPGDVLQISREADRHLERAAEPYSRRIAGVYATQPGVLLGDLDPEASVPLGVVGVVPTKVTSEGGAIRRGDLLVTSSTLGHAMKGDPERIGVGMVLGRALQDFDGEGTGVIEVLVNVQ